MQYINSRSLVNISVEQSYSYFTGYDRSVDFKASGAYVFRPNGSFPVLSEEKVPLTVFRGPLFDEVHQMINSLIYQIGPIPIDDGFGKEIVTRIKSKIENYKIFYTDSNGRDFLERINLGAYIKDENSQLSVLVDRSVGGSSIADGELEIMLHRFY